jgi:hypothetical protein
MQKVVKVELRPYSSVNQARAVYPVEGRNSKQHEFPVDSGEHSAIDTRVYPLSILANPLGLPKFSGRMTMLRKILLLALLVLAPSTSFAEEFTCPTNSNGDLTMQQFTECLINKYGADSFVTDGTVVGADNTGKAPFADEYSTPMSSNSMVTPLTPICTKIPSKPTTIIYSELTGAFNKNWCPTGVAKEALREKWWFQLNGWKLVEQKIFHCNVAAELAAMPPVVKTKICP